MRLHPSGSANAAILPLLLIAACAAPSTMRESSGSPEPVTTLVQPGAPGEATRGVTSVPPGESPMVHTEADVQFMQGMISHHAQALVMTAMLPGRGPSEGFSLLAERIEASQAAEIRLMQEWLRTRGEEVPDPSAQHHHHGGSMLMPGMLTDAQLDEMRAATGREFERLFLTYMISHHEGALTMVRDLFAAERSLQDPVTYRFASDVDTDQRMEIRRMRAMLGAL